MLKLDEWSPGVGEQPEVVGERAASRGSIASSKREMMATETAATRAQRAVASITAGLGHRRRVHEPGFP